MHLIRNNYENVLFELQGTEDLQMSRTNQFVNDLMQREGILTWDMMTRGEVFKWAGWVARLLTFDSFRITLHVLLHENWEWLQTIAIQNNGRQLHGRCLKIWCWEALIYSLVVREQP